MILSCGGDGGKFGNWNYVVGFGGNCGSDYSISSMSVSDIKNTCYLIHGSIKKATLSDQVVVTLGFERKCEKLV